MEPITGQLKRVGKAIATPQSRYSNGQSFAPGDWRPVAVCVAVLGLAWVAHDGFGVELPRPSSPVLEFFNDMWPVSLLLWGIYHGRTRKME